MLEKILEKIGLSEKEAKVYLAALELGPSTVQQIAKKADVVRPTTYVILDTLLKKGLMSSVDTGPKTLFSAEPPTQLGKYLDHQEQHLRDLRNDLVGVIPDLEAMFAQAGERPRVRFYDGVEGHDAAEDDYYRSLSPKDELFSFTPLDEATKMFPEMRAEQPHKRLEKKLWAHVLYTTEAGPQPEASSKSERRTARWLPKDKFPFRCVVAIIPGKRVQLTNVTGPLFAVLIEDGHIADTMKVIWDLAWEAAEKYQD